jgi:hypothetical protein
LLDRRLREHKPPVFDHRLLFALLLSCPMDENGQVEPGEKKLAHRLNCERHTIGRSLEWQERAGWIIITPQRLPNGNALIGFPGLARMVAHGRHPDGSAGAPPKKKDLTSLQKTRSIEGGDSTDRTQHEERGRAVARSSRSGAVALKTSKGSKRTEHGKTALPSEWQALAGLWSSTPTESEFFDRRDARQELDDEAKRELALAVVKGELIGIAEEDAGLDWHGNWDDDELVEQEFKKLVADCLSKGILSEDWRRTWTKWIIGAVQFRKRHEQYREKEMERRDERDRERGRRSDGKESWMPKGII